MIIIMKEEKINKKIFKLNRKKEKCIDKINKLELLKTEIYEDEKEIPNEKQLKKLEKREKYRRLNAPPILSTLEEIGNSIVHGLGAILAIIGFVLLILKSNTYFKLTASIFYSFSIFFMMLVSCLYHAFRSKSTVKRVFRRLDYSSIYLLIGGTFAPILLIYLDFPLSIILFIIQWIAIITGITLVSVFGPGRNKWIHFTMYFVIGWSGLMLIPSFIQNNLPLLFYILSGGLIYTLGMIPFGALRGKKCAHFIWHIIVLIASIVHFIGIYLYLY